MVFSGISLYEDLFLISGCVEIWDWDSKVLDGSFSFYGIRWG